MCYADLKCAMCNAAGTCVQCENGYTLTSGRCYVNKIVNCIDGANNLCNTCYNMIVN